MVIRILCIILAVIAVLAIAFSALKYYILINFAINARARDLRLMVRRKKVISDREQEVRRQIQEDREWLASLPMEDLEITAWDGVKLVGHYIPTQGEPRRLMVLFHGWRGSWTGDFCSMSRWLREIGCDLLMTEQRGQGDSGGKYMGFGILERRDVADWLRYLEQVRHNTLPIYLGGVSMGASTVLMASGDPMPDSVKGILADCGFTSPYEMIYEVGRKSLHLREHPAMDLVNLLVRLLAHYDLKEYSTLEALQKTTLSVFFSHGLADDFVPSRMTRKAYEACASRKDLLLVEEAGHVRSFSYAEAEYRRKVEMFFGWQD